MSGPSSPESDPGYPVGFYDFKIVDDRVYARHINKKGDFTHIKRLSTLQANPVDFAARNMDGTKVRMIDTTNEWTEFFLKSNVKLTGRYTCANNLKNGSSSSAAKVLADCLLLYCSDKEKKVKGIDRGPIAASEVNIIHLTDDGASITLHPGVYYAIGTLH